MLFGEETGNRGSIPLRQISPATLQCGDAPIFMAGDADHSRPVLHEAQAEGTLAGRNAACFPEMITGRRMVPFSIIFTDPALANIGELDGKDSVIASASYEDQGRAKVEGVNRGLPRLHADSANGKLIGAVLATPAAEHMAHFLVMAIDRDLTASEIPPLPFYHPTFEEGLKPALREICSRTGGPVGMERDAGFLAGARGRASPDPPLTELGVSTGAGSAGQNSG